MIQLRKIAGVLLCVLFATFGHAQTIRGTVKDTTGNPVPYATVNLKNNPGNTIIGYTMTDSKGIFALKVPANIIGQKLTVEVHSMGYLTGLENTTAADTTIDFVLTKAIIQLQEVIATSKRPVLRNIGDTLIYHVSDFANPQDQAIIDVIKKLPGITVAKDGTIRYNNQTVSGVYLGGDDLLDDKYSIATNNIPSGTVSQVQVIQNNQPVKVLQNKIMSEDVALNLVFKKNAKLRWIGQESIGLGLPGNYDIDLNAMMFKNNYKAINYLGGNNTGYDIQKELVSHNLTDYLQRIDNSIPPPVLSLGSVNSPDLADNRFLFNKAGIVNLNNLIKLKKNVQLRVNAYYLHDSQRQGYSQQTLFFLPGDTVVYNEVQHNRSVPSISHGQFTLNINREKYYLNNILQVDHKNSTVYSELKTDSSAVNQLLHDNIRRFSNELNLISTGKSNKIIQLYSYISHSTKPEKLAISPGYNAFLFNNNIPYSQLVQRIDIPGWYTNNYFSFRLPGKLITQSYRTGFSVQSQTLQSDLSIVQNNNAVKLQSDSTWNRLNWTKKKIYVEGAYDFPGTILKAKLTIPVTLQQINYSGNAHLLNGRLAGLYFNPQLNVKWKVSRENYVNLFYTYRNQVGTILDIYRGYVLTNYRTLYANNADLAEQQMQQAGVGFSYRKAIKLFFWNINTVYDHSKAGNILATVFSNTIQQGIVLPYPNSTGSWTVNGSISKYIFALRTTISGTMQWRRTSSVQLQNNTILPFKTFSEIVNLNTDTKITKKVNVSYKGTWTQVYSHLAVGITTSRVNQLLQQMAINYDPADLVHFKLSGEHYFTRQKGSPDLKYFFADASVRFSITKWKTEFEISSTNFLNVKKYSALHLSANTFTTSSFTLPGRIILLKALFKI
jgi:hypothetical protein